MCVGCGGVSVVLCALKHCWGGDTRLVCYHGQGIPGRQLSLGAGSRDFLLCCGVVVGGYSAGGAVMEYLFCSSCETMFS